MHIQFLRDVHDPDTKELLYHKGEKIHRERAVCVPYLDRKAAVEVRPMNYVESFKARAEEFAVVQKPAHTDWSVNAGSASGEVYILGRCTNPTCDVIRYHGPAGKFNTLSTHGIPSRVFDPAVEIVLAHACGKGAEKISAEIWKRYATAKSEEKQFCTPDQATLYQMQNYVGQDNKHREIESAPRK